MTKERIEELRESINLSCDAFIPLDEGERADLLALLNEQAEPEKVAQPTEEERREMVSFLHRACARCDERLFGGTDCEGIITEGPAAKCYAQKQAIRALVLAPPEPTKVSREFVFNLLLELYGQVDGYKLNKAIEMFREKGIVAKEDI